LRHGRRWRDRSGIALTTVANEQESGSGAPQQGIDPPEERQFLPVNKEKTQQLANASTMPWNVHSTGTEQRVRRKRKVAKTLAAKTEGTNAGN